MRSELARLQNRNELTALADKAISQGDVVSYNKLEELASTSPDQEQKSAALSELFRVYQFFSVFSGVTRTDNIHLNTAAVNPAKQKEEDLDAPELLRVLREAENPMARLRAAQLVVGKAKHGSYSTIVELESALRRETNLDAMQKIGHALAKVTGHDVGDKLDFRNLLKWVDENRGQLKADDPDVKMSSSPTPQSESTTAMQPARPIIIFDPPRAF